MRACSDAREADGTRHAIDHPRHPPVVVIAAGNHRRYRKGSRSMSGGKAAAFEWRFAAIKKRIVKVAASSNIGRPLSAGNGLYGKVHHGAICVCLGSKYRGAYLIAVLARVPRNQEGRGNRDYLGGGDRRIEGIVEAVQILCVILKIRHHMRVSNNQPCGHAGDAKGRQPMVSLGQLYGKRPNIFLIAKKVPGQALPCHLAGRRRRAAVPFGTRRLRGIIGQAAGGLRTGKCRRARDAYIEDNSEE